MRFFLWILGLFVSAVGLAIVVRFSHGNVVFFWPPYRIDLSLNFFLLLSLLFFVLMFLIVKAIHLACKLPSEIAAYRNRKREGESNQALKESLGAFFEGRFEQSGKMAVKAMEWEQNKACSAMIAAQAFHAFRGGNPHEPFLKTAEDDSVFATACRVTRVKWLIDDHKPYDALEEISRLNAEGVQYSYLQKLSLEANRQVGNWNEVMELVHGLERCQALPETVVRQLKKQAYESIFSQSVWDEETMAASWKAVPPIWQKQPSIAIRAAWQFYRAGRLGESGDILTGVLNENWDTDLMRAYAEFSSEKETADLEKRIECCQKWKENYSMHSQWTLTLGELYYKWNRFEPARFYLEETIEKQPELFQLQRAHFLLARLCEKDNLSEQAACHYRESSLAIQNGMILSHELSD